MIDSTATIGGWVAHIAFWVLIALGAGFGMLGRMAVAVFVALWLAGLILLPRITLWSGPLVTSWIAVLDIVLVFLVLKGDERLQ